MMECTGSPVLQDPHAVIILAQSGQELGYVPRYASAFVTEALVSCDPRR